MISAHMNWKVGLVLQALKVETESMDWCCHWYFCSQVQMCMGAILTRQTEKTEMLEVFQADPWLQLLGIEAGSKAKVQRNYAEK